MTSFSLSHAHTLTTTIMSPATTRSWLEFAKWLLLASTNMNVLFGVTRCLLLHFSPSKQKKGKTEQQTQYNFQLSTQIDSVHYQCTHTQLRWTAFVIPSSLPQAPRSTSWSWPWSRAQTRERPSTACLHAATRLRSKTKHACDNGVKENEYEAWNNHKNLHFHW